MSDITFSREETDLIVSKIKAYFQSELDQDIGGFEAEFLMDFITKELGPYFYNRGLSDARVLLLEKADELDYLVQELEKPML